MYHVKRYSPPKLSTYTSLEMQELLASKVIYNKHDIVALWKPYGMTMFNTPEQLGGNKRGKEKDSQTRKLLAIETYLPHLADKLGCSALHEVGIKLGKIKRISLVAGSQTGRDHNRSSPVCKDFSHARHAQEAFCPEKSGEDIRCDYQWSAQVRYWCHCHLNWLTGEFSGLLRELLTFLLEKERLRTDSG